MPARHHELTLYPTIAEALTRGGPGARRRRRAADRRARAIPAQQPGPDALSPLRVLPADRRGLPPERSSRPGLQRQAPVVEVGLGRRRWSTRPTSWAFPFMAGSSLPVTWRIPSVDVPWGAESTRSSAWATAGSTATTSTVWRRSSAWPSGGAGGETGVAAVQALRGEPVWKALAEDSWASGGLLPRRSSRPASAVASPWPRLAPGYGQRLSRARADAAACPRPGALPHRVCRWPEGHAAHALADWSATSPSPSPTKGRDDVLSTQMYLPGLHPGQTLPNFFSPLAHHIETMFLTGQAPLPRRANPADDRHPRGGDRLAEPGRRSESRRPTCARIAYQAPRESTFLRS